MMRLRAVSEQGDSAVARQEIERQYSLFQALVLEPRLHLAIAFVQQLADHLRQVLHHKET